MAKELGKLNPVLEIKVARSTSGIFISQKYINDLLKDISKLAYKLSSETIDPNHKLGLVEEDAEIGKRINRD